jgi:hypothetical protein
MRREDEERGGEARRRSEEEEESRGADLTDAIWLRSQLRPLPSQRGCCGFKAFKAEGRACARSSGRQGCLCASFLCPLCVCCVCAAEARGSNLPVN